MEVEFKEDYVKFPEKKFESKLPRAMIWNTAVVQLHAWGSSLKEAYEQCGMAMFGYMTSLDLEITKFDVENFTIECKCYGKPFEIGKYPQGTEVTAITYSAMQVIQNPDENRSEVFVIIDI